jgi:hypothetical protein
VNTILQPARALVFVKKVGGDDAIRPEMPKILTKFTQGCQHAHGLSIADDYQPDAMRRPARASDGDLLR